MRSFRFLLAAVFLLSLFPLNLSAQEITTPEKFFGFQLGADKKMARWDKIVDYYAVLEKQSTGRMKVINMGPTSMGNPFLMVIITAPANMARLDRLREINSRLSDPRGLSEAQAHALVDDGKAVIVQSMSMHATEIGGAQMAPELAYDLLARKDEETRRILDNVVFIEVPCFNPDGEIMVTDWYNKQLGTAYEGTNPPWLYQKYAGHDNNRDAFQTNIPDSQYMARILFTEWRPEAYVDHHGMGGNGARIFLPPYAEPMRPGADPILWRELSWYGAHMAYKEEEAGLSGAINNAIYSGWGHFGFHWITPFHNIAGMLTESAAARLASPQFMHLDQLRGNTRNLPVYEAETIFPNPWPGGWWHLRDIVDRQKVSAWATLDLAARNRETVLWNAYLKGKRQTERGAAGKPAAYLISTLQHDPLTGIKMVNKLLVQGIEIQRATKPFTTAAGMSYPTSSFVVSMAQPKMGLIRYLLGRTFYPDNEWTRNRDGSPTRPYDMATDTMFEYMGVRVDPVDELGEVALVKLTGAIEPAGAPRASNATRGASGSSPNGYSMDGRLNDSFRAANLLWNKNVALRRVDKPSGSLRAGDFLVAPGSEAVLEAVARQTGVDFTPLPAAVSTGAHDTARQRIAMYQRYGGGNIDEGWTRLVLEQFSFPYSSIFDPEIKKGGLNDKYDVLIFPNDSTATITGDAPAGGAAAAGRGGRSGSGGGAGGGLGGGEGGGRGGNTPPEYRTGFGAEGVNGIRDFVQKGGTLVTLNAAAAFPVDRLGIGVRNVLSGKTTKEFWCPGSTLKATFDNTNPLAYGMPSHGLALYLDSPAFEITAQNSENYEVVVRYADRELLESGWLVGEENLAHKAAVVSAKLGQGKVVLLGFPAQHRAQTHGTYKLLFNALLR
ncbi:MAG TPA: M14 family metallopeptidase [Candidatus Acidoferrales bacterium]|nr:M14 family metallopeptidase [Candidatus Acidoferrales bacterium]